MTKELRPALLVFLSLTMITGLVYPGVVTGLAQLLFGHHLRTKPPSKCGITLS